MYCFNRNSVDQNNLVDTFYKKKNSLPNYCRCGESSWGDTAGAVCRLTVVLSLLMVCSSGRFSTTVCDLLQCTFIQNVSQTCLPHQMCSFKLPQAIFVYMIFSPNWQFSTLSLLLCVSKQTYKNYRSITLQSKNETSLYNAVLLGVSDILDLRHGYFISNSKSDACLSRWE